MKVLVFLGVIYGERCTTVKGQRERGRRLPLEEPTPHFICGGRAILGEDRTGGGCRASERQARFASQLRQLNGPPQTDG